MKSRWLWALAGFVLVGVFSGVAVARERAYNQAAERAQVASAVNLGIAYITLNPRVCAYYELGVSSGALVTDVAANSPADRAGIRPGEVILSFNGTRVEERVPLLGMMRQCMAGSMISLEVWDGRSVRVVELLHVQ